MHHAVHLQHEPCGSLAGPDRGDQARGLGNSAAEPAEALGHGQCQQPGFGQLLEIGERKTSIRVVLGGGRGKLLTQFGQQLIGQDRVGRRAG